MGLIGYWMFSGSLFCGGSPPFSPSLRMAKEILLRLLYCDQGPFPLMPEGGGGGRLFFSRTDLPFSLIPDLIKKEEEGERKLY